MRGVGRKHKYQNGIKKQILKKCSFVGTSAMDAERPNFQP